MSFKKYPKTQTLMYCMFFIFAVGTALYRRNHITEAGNRCSLNAKVSDTLTLLCWCAFSAGLSFTAILLEPKSKMAAVADDNLTNMNIHMRRALCVVLE